MTGLDVPLTDPPLSQWTDAIEARLPELRGRVEVYAETRSTQDVAAAGAQRGPRVVVAGRQTRGRGRRGRAWLAADDACLTFSWVACPPPPAATAAGLAVTASIAVAEAVDALARDTGAAPPAARIKWPNDVCVDAAKLAGVLVEQRGDAAVVGVGLNVRTPAGGFPPTLAGPATSLQAIGVPTHRLSALLAVLPRLDRRLNEPDPDALRAAWRTRSQMRDTAARFRCGNRVVEGVVVDLDADCGLIVRTLNGQLVHLPAHATTRV